MIEIPDKTMLGLHEIVPGLTMEWLFDGRVYIATLSSIKHQTVDAFVDLNKQIIQHYPPNEFALTVQDVSAANLTITSHLRQRVGEIWEAMRVQELEGYMAFVVNRGPLAALTKLFISTSNRFVANKMSLDFFTERDKAITFVKNKLQ